MSPPLDQVPEPFRARVSAAIEAAFPGGRVEGVVPVGVGWSSAAVLRAVVDGQPWLVRAIREADAFNDPRRHHRCLAAASAAGLAPRLRFADDESGVTVSEWIASRPLSECPRPALLDGLGELVRRLQALPRFPPLVDYVCTVASMLADLRTTAVVPRSAGLDRFEALAAAIPREPDALVSAHNDLNPTNLLWDGARLWLVDWEAAFASDRFADPAQAVNFFATSPEDELRLLTACFGRPPDRVQRARVWAMCQVAHVFYAVMLLRMGRAADPELQIPAAALDGPRLATLRGQKQGAMMASGAGRAQYAAALLGEVDRTLRTGLEEALPELRGR